MEDPAGDIFVKLQPDGAPLDGWFARKALVETRGEV
jgi:hypothetical protein